MADDRKGGTILVVDDVPENIAALSGMLRAQYRVLFATRGHQALELVRQQQIDLILLDVMMPDMDGYEVLRRLQEQPATAAVPVIFVTALDDDADEERGLRLGAVDYISKPIRPRVLLARVRTHIDAHRARQRLRAAVSPPLPLQPDDSPDSSRLQWVSHRAMAQLALMRDPHTRQHELRTQGFVRELALVLREEPRHAGWLDDRRVELLVEAAPLHDIGKAAIPDSLLTKAGPLTADEWVVMRTHTTLGEQAIASAGKGLQQAEDFLQLARQMALSHHERWDGLGYPQGLAGRDIPLAARLMAVADVLDALTSPRSYKPMVGAAEARRIVLAESGHHFDPDVVQAFERCFDHLAEIIRVHAL